MNATIPLGHAWTSPFAKWGGSLAEVSSLDVAEAVTRRALADRGVDVADLDELVLGWTVPQRDVFYGAPSLASRLGAPTCPDRCWRRRARPPYRCCEPLRAAC
jgi:acetyl-CoA acetyltransferase